MLLSIVLITFSLERLQNRRFLLVIALVLATLLRSYITIIFVFSILFSIFSSKGNLKNNNKIILFVLTIISSYFILPLVNNYLFDGNFQNLSSLIEQKDFYTKVTSMGTYSIDPNSNLIWKIFSYNFRPFFYEIS